ncbi:MAG: FtsX-like permease family protein, partial [Rhodothermales bacterium]
MSPKSQSYFQRFIAIRYLTGQTTGREGSRFVRFVIYAAIGGVAVGVATLLLAISITRGFSVEIEKKIVDFGSHVQVENFLDAPLDGTGKYVEELSAIPGVIDVAPVVQELALLRTSTDIDGIALWGTSEESRLLSQYLVQGSLSANDSLSSKPGIVVSRSQSRMLGVGLGDVVTCFSMREVDGGSLLNARPRVKQFSVSGIYDTGFSEVDDRYAFVNIVDARQLLGYRADQSTRFDLRLADISMADSVVARIEDRIGFPTMSRTVFEVHRNIFAWVGLQESMIPLVIAIIVLVAAFNIVGTLLMLVLEKTGEIGILQSMGATRRTVRQAFIWLGLLIGVVGIGLGEGIAFVVAFVQQRYGVIPLPRETYFMDTAPVLLDGFDFVLVAAIALVLCVIAAYAPA